MQNRPFRPFPIILYSTLFLAAYCAYSALLEQYPFYFMWDMDQTTVVDSLLIRTGILPVHIHHPGFGMYLVLSASQRIAQVFDLLSLNNLTDVAYSLNPILGVAELSNFFRAHSPWIATITVATLWWALTIHQKSPLVRVISLVVLATQSSLFYHSTMIRTELYSAFFWSAAVLSVSLASRRSNRTHAIALAASGLFTGLAFLTKVQSFFYLFTIPAIYFFLGAYYDLARPTLSKKTTRFLSSFCILSIALLLVGANFRHAEGMTFTDHYPFNLWGALLLLLGAGLFVSEREPIRKKIRINLSAAHLLLSGFMLSFFTHFFVFSNLNLSYKYMLMDTKMLFFRDNFQGGLSGFDAVVGLAKNLSAGATEIWPSIVLGGIALYLLCYRRGRKSAGAWGLSLFLLVCANLALAHRSMLRDLIWIELLPNFLALLYFSFAWRELQERAYRKRTAILGLSILLAAFNIQNSLAMPKKIDANYNLYGWHPDRSFEAVYVYSQMKFDNLMRAKYHGNTVERDAAARFALNYKRHLRDVRFGFPNQSISLRDISEVREGSPVWKPGQGTIASVPTSLRGAILVDNWTLPTKNLFFDAPAVRNQIDTWDKIRYTAKENTIAVLGRSDLNIYFFSTEPRLVRGPTITILQNGQEIEYFGNLVRGYAEVNRGEFTTPGFFVIKQKP